MRIASTKGRFAVDKNGKCFIFANNLYIKKGRSILLFIFNCNWHLSNNGHLENSGRILNVLLSEGNKDIINITLVVMRLKVR